MLEYKNSNRAFFRTGTAAVVVRSSNHYVHAMYIYLPLGKCSNDEVDVKMRMKSLA